MMGYGLFGFGMVLMVLFWIAIIAGAVWLVMVLVRGGQSRTGTPYLPPGAPASQTPLDILKARYARGEINKEQFDAMRRDLEV
ncbi:MAG: SHOCT domain-containing protein [Rudaea sp.]